MRQTSVGVPSTVFALLVQCLAALPKINLCGEAHQRMSSSLVPPTHYCFLSSWNKSRNRSATSAEIAASNASELADDATAEAAALFFPLERL